MANCRAKGNPITNHKTSPPGNLTDGGQSSRKKIQFFPAVRCGKILAEGCFLQATIQTGRPPSGPENGATLGAGLGNTVATLSLGNQLILDSAVLLFDINRLADADKLILASGVTTIILPNTTPLVAGKYTLNRQHRTGHGHHRQCPEALLSDSRAIIV
jgi:hypothetical protein